MHIMGAVAYQSIGEQQCHKLKLLLIHIYIYIYLESPFFVGAPSNIVSTPYWETYSISALATS